MATTIVGVRINSVNIEEQKEKEGPKLTGSYSLISDKGKVLATQGFNGYEQIKVAVSPEVIRQLLKSVEKTVALTIGLEEE
ncbi:hypothetical protein ES703_60588 [subsurface metagenome]